MAMGLFGLVVLGALYPAAASQPRSNYALNVLLNASRTGEIDVALQMQPLTGNGSYQFWAMYMTANVSLGPQLSWDANQEAGGSEAQNATNVSGLQYFNFTMYIAPATRQLILNNPNGTYFAGFTVVATYSDNLGFYNRTLVRTLSFALNYSPVPPPPVVSLVPAALMGVGGAGSIWVILYVRRRARLEELYLMHDSGMLIRHWSRDGGNPHDSDIMSGMIIVLQEFVRDTWKSHQDEDAPLEQLRFGSHRVLLARGDHTVLAAVIRGRYLNGLPQRLSTAVEDFEQSNADRLRDWNGNVDVFPRVDQIAQQFMGTRSRSPT